MKMYNGNRSISYLEHLHDKMKIENIDVSLNYQSCKTNFVTNQNLIGMFKIDEYGYNAFQYACVGLYEIYKDKDVKFTKLKNINSILSLHLAMPFYYKKCFTREFKKKAFTLCQTYEKEVSKIKTKINESKVL